MRPICITIEGLRSFRSPVTVDFADRDHIAIIGDTGSGKSSILEAITYALYGKATFKGRTNRELMNDISTELRVVLRFQISGATWEVARNLRRTRRGDVLERGTQLCRLGDDGSKIEQVEQKRRVDEHIEKLIGLDREAFLRTVVLPQGRFARLLVEDEPRDRSQILRQIWRTDDLEAAGEMVGDARSDLADVLAELERTVKEYPEDPAAHLDQLREALDGAVRRAVAADADERASVAALDKVSVAQKSRRTACHVAEGLSDLDIGKIAARLAPIAALSRQIQEKDAAFKERELSLKRELDRVPTDGGPSAEEVAAVLVRLASLPEHVASCEKASAQLRSDRDEASQKRAAAEHAAEQYVAAQETSTAYASKRAGLEKAVQVARERVSALEKDYARHDERLAEADRLRDDLDSLREEKAECAQKLATAEKAAAQRAHDVAAAEERFRVAHRSEAAAAAASQLHTGDSCPICRRELPVGWERPPGSTGLEKATEVAEIARNLERKADSRVTELRTRSEDITRRMAELQTKLEEQEVEVRREASELARTVGLEAAASLPNRDALLAPFQAKWEEAADLLAEHEHAAVKARDAASQQDKEASLAKGAADSADRAARASCAAAVQAVKSLADAVSELPPQFRPVLDIPSEAAELRTVDTRTVEEQVQAARERNRLLEDREAHVKCLRKQIETAQRERAVLARRSNDEVEESLDSIRHDLGRYRDILRDSIGRLDLESVTLSVALTRDVAALEHHIEDLRTARAEVSDAVTKLLRDASHGEDAGRATVAMIGRKLGIDVGTSSLGAVGEKVRSHAEDARFMERRARGEVEKFEPLVERIERLHVLVDEVGAKERALRDLEEALKPGRFLKWLTLRRCHALLAHASRLLREMSAEKYEFAEPGDVEEQWRVLDRDSGHHRSPASLSGGEQFIASLSLALGMVEMMARSGGRLESLFLDEGFASLDRNNLDTAIQALTTVTVRGRMVGVISHIRAVAEQIDHVLSVTRGATGSQATWLTNQQRRRLSDEDVGVEAASALGGLLE